MQVKDSKGNVVAEADVTIVETIGYREYKTITIIFYANKSMIKKPGADLNDPGLDIYFVN